MAGFFLLTLCFLCVSGVFGDEVKTVKEGDSVTLNSDVTKQQHEPMLWYFNDTLIAFINEDPSKSCLYDGKGGIFRDRLEVNYETGSLTITNIRSEHTGHYELEYIRSDGTGTITKLNRKSKCNSTRIIRKHNSDDIKKSFRLIVDTVTEPKLSFVIGKDEYSAMNLSAGVTAGIFVVFLLVFGVVGVIYSRRKIPSRNERQRINRELLQKIPSAPV